MAGAYLHSHTLDFGDVANDLTGMRTGRVKNCSNPVMLPINFIRFFQRSAESGVFPRNSRRLRYLTRQGGASQRKAILHTPKDAVYLDVLSSNG